MSCSWSAHPPLRWKNYYSSKPSIQLTKYKYIRIKTWMKLTTFLRPQVASSVVVLLLRVWKVGRTAGRRRARSQCPCPKVCEGRGGWQCKPVGGWSVTAAHAVQKVPQFSCIYSNNWFPRDRSTFHQPLWYAPSLSTWWGSPGPGTTLPRSTLSPSFIRHLTDNFFIKFLRVINTNTQRPLKFILRSPNLFFIASTITVLMA